MHVETASADTRSKRQKMEDRASDPASSASEVETARRWLEAHPVRVLSREDILAAPDVRASVREVRYYDDYLKAWVTMEVDVVDAAVDEYLRGQREAEAL